jgi:serine/threonine protein kinase
MPKLILASSADEVYNRRCLLKPSAPSWRGKAMPMSLAQSQWFIARNKQKLGPFSWAELQACAADGELAAADMVLHQGASKWIQACEVPGLFLTAAAAPETRTHSHASEPLTVSYRESETLVQADPAWPKIPGYHILAEIGRGGMGIVYKARHLPLKRLVAIKMVLSGTQAATDDLARFRAEAEAVARLHHPNIVQIYEIGTHEGRPFFALEFVEGGTLSQQLKGNPQSPRQAAVLVETLARAMQAAHEGGIVHRDLKPGNVLMMKDGAPKVADFGLAKQLDADQAQTRTGAIMGTPAYMAPEQASGKIKELGPLSDVYALGVILYEMLTGGPPFKGETTWHTLEQVRTLEPVPPRRLQPKVPRDLETICLKCLEKAPARRFASARDLADDLGRYLRGESVQARPLRASERVWRWCRRHPLVAASTTLAFVSLLAWMTYLGTRPAYLDIRVEPKTAEVLLDDVEVPLEDGRALVATGPGKHQITVRAAEHIAREQSVLLVRGRDNAAFADVRLESAFGYFHAATNPSGAAVHVYDDKDKLIDQGVTPYNSARIPHGNYRLNFQLGFHEDATATASVESGERLTKMPPVTLTPLAGASMENSQKSSR